MVYLILNLVKGEESIMGLIQDAFKMLVNFVAVKYLLDVVE